MSGNVAVATTVPPGTWHGDAAVLTIDARQIRIEAGTGLATLKAPLRTDAKGRFKSTGSFEAYRPGPQRADVPPSIHPALVTGSIKDGVIVLNMRVDGERSARKFTFSHGRVAKIVRPM